MVTGISPSNALIDTKVSENQFNSMDSVALMAKRLVERAKEERADVAIDFNRGDFIRATQRISRMVAFKEKISDNLSAATKAKTAINSIKDILAITKIRLQGLLGSSSVENKANVAEAFNKDIKDINSRADSAGQKIGFRTLNLVGNVEGPEWKTDDIFTSTGTSGRGPLSILGAFLGTDYQIKDDDGFYWRLDATDDTFYQYEANGKGQQTGKSISAEGLIIDNYDPASGSITYAGSSSLSGTLERAGLNLLTSEYYKNFEDDTSIQTAINDINNAISIVNQKGSPILASATLFQGQIKSIDLKIDNLEEEKDNIRQEELDDSRAQSLAADMRVQMTLNNINLLTQTNNGLVENMLNLTRGPAAAPGLFGIMGY